MRNENDTVSKISDDIVQCALGFIMTILTNPETLQLIGFSVLNLHWFSEVSSLQFAGSDRYSHSSFRRSYNCY